MKCIDKTTPRPLTLYLRRIDNRTYLRYGLFIARRYIRHYRS
jgi:hypothetical protein